MSKIKNMHVIQIFQNYNIYPCSICGKNFYEEFFYKKYENNSFLICSEIPNCKYTKNLMICPLFLIIFHPNHQI